MVFKNREDGARQLLPKLNKFKDVREVVVLGLPRGGMITAQVVAKGLNLPLGFMVVKKIGAPDNPELALGAVAEDGTFYMNEDLSSTPQEYIKQETSLKLVEARARGKLYRGEGASENLDNKTVILVDDGMATGTSILAAILSAKKLGARKVVVAVPIASTDSAEKVKKEAELISVSIDSYLTSVGQFYEDFPQVEDREVLKLLQKD